MQSNSSYYHDEFHCQRSNSSDNSISSIAVDSTTAASTVSSSNFSHEVRIRPSAMTRAARRIQKLWKRYRDAVQHYEEEALSFRATMSAAGRRSDSRREQAVRLQAAAAAIQRLWRQYQQAITVRAPEGSVAAAAVSVAEASSNIQNMENAEAIIPLLTRLQRRFRCRRERQEWAHLHDIVRRRHENDAARRLQEHWRRARYAWQHKAAANCGLRANAASCIQVAFRKYRYRTKYCSSPRLAEYDQNEHCFTKESIARPENRSAAVNSNRNWKRCRHDSDSSNCEITCVSSNESVVAFPSCFVCIGAPVQVALVPCGHAQMCRQCAARVRRCPSCRQVIGLRFQIFL